MNAAPRIVVTGAGGWLGGRLVKALLGDEAYRDAQIVVTDLDLSRLAPDPRLIRLVGDLADPSLVSRLLAEPPDIVFHMATILGGAAEANVELARRVNVDSSLSLLEGLRRPERPPRLVFASSIAVFGPRLPALVDDDTLASPLLVYGAHKRMIEVAIQQFSDRGWIDGAALRLPGIVARRDADGRLKSSYLHRLFFDLEVGRDVILPVAPDGASWLISADACAKALVHAGQLPADAFGDRRAFTLPAQRTVMAELVDALKARFPQSASTVCFAPNEEIQAQFASHPQLETPTADRLGFRHDGDLDTLVERAFH